MDVKSSIMQLSDLHKEVSAFPNIKAFVSSIISDMSHYQNEDIPISKPHFLVICGDIIQGYHEDADFEVATLTLGHQYDEAREILSLLSTFLFNGEKQRIVIVPGNHDISWPHSRRSMERIPQADNNLLEMSRHPESNVRWDFKDFSFYRISDPTLYEQRLLPFADFYRAFYEKKREYSLSPEKQYDIFEFPEHRILVAGFNSCLFNDHVNLIGRIHPECIASCYDHIRQQKYDDWLKIAVWHHGIHGFPNKQDFMDERIVQFLIDKGFQIGLHGHLHREGIWETKFSFDQSLSMLVLGCGSLSASPNSMPLGVSNQYSIIEIDSSLTKVRYHVRKTLPQPPDLPVWIPGNITQNRDKSYIEAIIKGPSAMEERSRSKSALTKELLSVDDLIRKNEYLAALAKLKTLDELDPIVRRFTVECLWQLDKDNELIGYLKHPETVTEFAYFSECLWRLDRMKELKELVRTISSRQDISGSEPYKRMIRKLADRGI